MVSGMHIYLVLPQRRPYQSTLGQMAYLRSCASELCQLQQRPPKKAAETEAEKAEEEVKKRKGIRKLKRLRSHRKTTKAAWQRLPNGLRLLLRGDSILKMWASLRLTQTLCFLCVFYVFQWGMERQPLGTFISRTTHLIDVT